MLSDLMFHDELVDTYLQERLAGFTDPFARLFVYELLADVSSPLGHDLLLNSIDLVKLHQNLGDCWEEVGMDNSN